MSTKTREKKKKLITVVDRKKWYRGKGAESSALLKQGGKMCCLGFRAIAGGAAPAAIKGAETPPDADGYKVFFSPRFYDPYGRVSELCQNMMNCNDSKAVDGREREAQLKRLFEEAEEEIQFEG